MSLQNILNLLVIDDDPMIINSIKLLLPKQWRMIATKDVPRDSSIFFHCAFVDMHLSPESNRNKKPEGPEFIETLSKQNPLLEIVAISGDLSLPLMETCLKNGAHRFLAKPLMVDEVLAILAKAESLWQLRASQSGRNQVQWIGSSSAAKEIQRKIAELHDEKGPILIEGETGSGKEVVFKLLNQQQAQRTAVPVNLASIPEDLFESEMFGSVKGAFTGADRDRMGLIESAQGGDLFLDEIEAMPMPQQAKILRFLETGEIRRVGSQTTTFVQTRVIAATNQKLESLAKEGKFREDLLFRISGKKVSIPPLRNRAEDIADLAHFFLQKERPRLNKTWSQEALVALKKYDWPGNVRELKRICEQVALVSPLPIIREQDLTPFLKPLSSTLANSTTDWSLGLSGTMEKIEAEIIQKALDLDKDVEKAAERLKISRSNLYKKMKDYNIQQENL